MRTMSFLFIAPFLILAGGPQALGDLIVNGGFETGDFSGWQTKDAASGSLFGVDILSPHSGRFAAFFGAESPPDFDAISQTLTTLPGESYVVEFWLRNEEGGSNFFEASFGTTTLITLRDANEFDYTLFRFNVVASSANTVLTFRSYNVASFFDLDDVSVNVAAVPEPSSLVLMGTCVLGLLGLGRSRRKCLCKSEE